MGSRPVWLRVRGKMEAASREADRRKSGSFGRFCKGVGRKSKIWGGCILKEENETAGNHYRIR
ncbi:hypothetical protein NC652_017926 [Populus alba x Populus x berolinensis]|nr:hypothetical protein NC652_017926 [Populus alba x Populus x berolinensis]